MAGATAAGAGAARPGAGAGHGAARPGRGRVARDGAAGAEAGPGTGAARRGAARGRGGLAGAAGRGARGGLAGAGPRRLAGGGRARGGAGLGRAGAGAGLGRAGAGWGGSPGDERGRGGGGSPGRPGRARRRRRADHTQAAPRADMWAMSNASVRSRRGHTHRPCWGRRAGEGSPGDTVAPGCTGTLPRWLAVAQADRAGVEHGRLAGPHRRSPCWLHATGPRRLRAAPPRGHGQRLGHGCEGDRGK
jgi:hypothetical protein